MFNSFHYKTIGPDHIAANKVCQDYVDSFCTDKYAVCVVSDGHGGSKYIRSEKGSRFAVESVLDTIKTYMDDFDAFSEAIHNDFEYVRKQIQMQFLARWAKKVDEDMAENELTEEEKAILAKENALNREYYKYYGATILFGVMTDTYNFGMLIGDGAYTRLSQECEAVIPIEDPYATANLTSSVCDKESISLFQQYFEKEKPLLLAVSTDGFAKTFATEEDFLDFQNMIACQLLIENSEEPLKKNVDRRSKSSGDDTSLALVYDPELLREKQKELVAKKNALQAKRNEKIKREKEALERQREEQERIKQDNLRRQEEAKRRQERAGRPNTPDPKKQYGAGMNQNDLMKELNRINNELAKLENINEQRDKLLKLKESLLAGSSLGTKTPDAPSGKADDVLSDEQQANKPKKSSSENVFTGYGGNGHFPPGTDYKAGIRGGNGIYQNPPVGSKKDNESEREKAIKSHEEKPGKRKTSLEPQCEMQITIITQYESDGSKNQPRDKNVDAECEKLGAFFKVYQDGTLKNTGEDDET